MTAVLRRGNSMTASSFKTVQNMAEPTTRIRNRRRVSQAACLTTMLLNKVEAPFGLHHQHMHESLTALCGIAKALTVLLSTSPTWQASQLRTAPSRVTRKSPGEAYSTSQLAEQSIYRTSLFATTL
eukprot:Rmarinus@m.19635